MAPYRSAFGRYEVGNGEKLGRNQGRAAAFCHDDKRQMNSGAG
jgi:hypothetical protein